MLDNQARIDAVAQCHPLQTKTAHHTFVEGLSVSDILREMDLPVRYGLPVVVLWRGQRCCELPVALWRLTRPKPGTRLEVSWPVNAPIGAVLSAIVAAGAPVVAGSVFGLTAGTMSFALATAAITMVGGLIVNALVPPPTLGLGNQAETNYSITGTQNAQNRHGVYPKVLGRHRMFPPMTARGFTEVIDGEIYYRGRYTFGHGPLMLEDLRIGNTPLTEFEDVEVEFLNVDQAHTEAAIPGISDIASRVSSRTSVLNAALTEVGASRVYRVNGHVSSARIQALVTFSGGSSVTLRLERRAHNGAGWEQVTDQTFTRSELEQPSAAVSIFELAREVGRRVRLGEGLVEFELTEPQPFDSELRLTWLSGDPQQVTWTEVEVVIDPTTGQIWRQGSERMTLYSRDVAEDPENTRLNHDVPVVRYSRDRSVECSIDITFPQGLGQIEGSSKVNERSQEFGFRFREVGSVDWTDAGNKICTGAERALVRFSKSITFPKAGEFEIEVTRLSPDSTSNDVVDDSYLSAVRSFRAGDLPSHDGVAEIALRIKASEQLNGQVDSLNAIVQQLAPVWDGHSWSDLQPVRHPAWVLADAYRGGHLRRPVRDDRFVLGDLKAWADQEPHWTCDFVVDTDMPVSEVVDLICATGRARRALTDLKYSVIRDLPAQPVRQLFSPRNSWGFKGSIAFPRDIHGLRVMVRSERHEWEQDEILVFRDGYSEVNATEFETLDLPGVVVTKDEGDQGNAWRLGRYYLAAAELRPEMFEFNADWESIRITRGDKIQFVHDVAKVGVGWGRIAELEFDRVGALSRLVLDERYVLPDGDYRLTVRDQTGERAQFVARSVDRGWNYVSGDTSTASVQVGDLVAIEELTQESLELLVTGVFPNADETARITAVPAAPEILNAVSGAIPNYAPVITDVTPRFGPSRAQVLQVVTGQSVAEVGRDGVLVPRLGIDLLPVSYPSGVWAVLRWRQRGGTWVTSQPLDPSRTLYAGPLADGLHYQLQVQLVNGDGRGQGFVDCGEHQARARDFDFTAPANFQATPGVGAIALTCDRYGLADFAFFRFFGAQLGSDNLTVIGEASTPQFSYTGSFERFRVCAVDHSGVAGPLSSWAEARPRGVAMPDLAPDVSGAIDDARARIDLLGTAATANAEAVSAVASFAGGLGATVSEHSVTLNGIMGEHSILLDNNGRVSGLVMRSERGNDGAVISDVTVLASVFKIAASAEQPQSPFVVYSEPTMVDGALVAAGVYMKKAFIRAASVGTLEIEGNAVTLPVRSYSDGTVLVPATSVTNEAVPQNAVSVASVALNRRGYSTSITFSCNFHSVGIDPGSIDFWVFRNGVDIRLYTDVTGEGGAQVGGGFSTVDDDLGLGPTTYEVRATVSDPNYSGAYTASQLEVFRRSLMAVQFQR